MKLSTKGRYAITAMMELALRHKEGPVTLAEISAEQSISVSYLEQLFAMLRKAGLVTGLRGPGGGYCLRRPAGEITIAEILHAVDERVTDAARLDTEGEHRELPRSVMLWHRLSNRIHDYLNSITLADAVRDEALVPTNPPEQPQGDGEHRSAA
jgi:Rrf2 family iron-sulfur cluster assembly transcriptional regulator